MAGRHGPGMAAGLPDASNHAQRLSPASNVAAAGCCWLPTPGAGSCRCRTAIEWVLGLSHRWRDVCHMDRSQAAVIAGALASPTRLNAATGRGRVGNQMPGRASKAAA